MRPQRTLKHTVVLKGKGIHSGKGVKVSIKQAPVDAGVIFIRTDLKKRPRIPASPSYLTSDSGSLRCTAVEKDGVRIYTIEHIMAAISSLGIDNAEIEIDGEEFPNLDGSAREYAYKLRTAGTVDQDRQKREFKLEQAVWFCDGDGTLIAVPSDRFSVSYVLQYEGPDCLIQGAHFSFKDFDDKRDIFIKEIAGARTFCRERDVAHILEKGLGRGGSYRNTLVIRDGEPIGNKFRFTNEPARHKILDLLGDLALLNVEICAHIIGIRSGHALNAKLVRELAMR